LTFGERRRRADVQLIQRDFEELESAFVSGAQKLNKKRQAQMIKRVEKVLGELREAFEKGDNEEVEGILASLQMPSQKEWRKLIRKLIFSATKAGILRAHFELMRLKELYEFDEDTWEVIPEGYDYDVIYPKEALEFLEKYSLEISVITDETVLNRIRKELKKGLEEGLNNRDLIANIKETAGTWMSDWHAQTIARTESSKMYNAGRLARWLDPENNGFVEALQYDAIVDKRTTQLCRHLDGMIVSITRSDVIAEYTPPNHFQCRATWLPVTKYEEWEDNFQPTEEPEKGFTFVAPLPKLLKGKTEPLVQPKKKIDPRTITDPDVIRNLPDDDFKIAIGNIKDIALKLAMVKERAEQMLVKETGLKEEVADALFTYWGYNSDTMKGTFEMFDTTYEFFMTPDMKETVEQLVRDLYEAGDERGNDALKEVVEKFAEKHGSNPVYSDLIAKLRLALSRVKYKMTWNGLKPVRERSRESEKLLTIQLPPMTPNFKNATGLQQAIKDAQAWLLKYVDERLTPATGIKLRFKHDLKRAYATGATGEIFFGRYENDAGVVVHESAHVMHWNNKAVADLIHEFYMQRTKNMTVPKRVWYNSKGQKEWAYPDDFFSYYVGREYGWEKRYEDYYREEGYVTHGFLGQEVLSMGMQALYSNPEKFYQDDKEHFLLTYAILRGLF
jgi:SPP1 gp7 family putative phage head morphogenesis protein